MEQMNKQPYERIIFVCANQKDPGEAACLNRGSGEYQKQLKEYQKSKNIKADWLKDYPGGKEQK